MSQIPIQAVIDDATSFENVCSNYRIQMLIDDAAEKSPRKNYYNCNDSERDFMVQVKLNSGDYACVDAFGLNVLDRKVLSSAIDCKGNKGEKDDSRYNDKTDYKKILREKIANWKNVICPVDEECYDTNVKLAVVNTGVDRYGCYEFLGLVDGNGDYYDGAETSIDLELVNLNTGKKIVNNNLHLSNGYKTGAFTSGNIEWISKSKKKFYIKQNVCNLDNGLYQYRLYNSTVSGGNGSNWEIFRVY